MDARTEVRGWVGGAGLLLSSLSIPGLAFRARFALWTPSILSPQGSGLSSSQLPSCPQDKPNDPFPPRASCPLCRGLRGLRPKQGSRWPSGTCQGSQPVSLPCAS